MTAPRRTGTGMFGWCLDALHDRCTTTTASGHHHCTCPCHDTPAPAHEGPSETIGC